MIEILTRNAAWKLFSLAVAVALWLSVSSEPEMATFVRVRVEYKDLPEELTITSNVVESVYLELRGPSGDLRNFADSSRVAVVLDMSTARPGEQTFTLGENNIDLPRTLRLVRAIPPQLRFRFERLVVRNVPVEARFSRTPPRGYAVAGYTVNPTQLIVRGPESHVANLKSAVTDPIDLSGVVGISEFRVNAFANDPQVQLVSSPDVSVTVMVKKQ